jgi:hypothetical protein
MGGNFLNIETLCYYRRNFEETLKDLQKHTTPSTPAIIVINDFEEKQVEDLAIKKAKQARQLVEVEQSTIFSS